jgi:hypothetical protein
MATLPPRLAKPIVPRGGKTKGKRTGFPLNILERETSLELATSTLARLRSTN